MTAQHPHAPLIEGCTGVLALAELSRKGIHFWIVADGKDRPPSGSGKNQGMQAD